MKHNFRALGALACIAVAAATFSSQAQAGPALSITLTPATSVGFNGAVGADIFVSDLTGAVGGYYFDLNFDISRMSFNSFVADPDTKMGDGLNPAIDVSGGLAGGKVGIGMLSGFTLPTDEAALAVLQGTGFKLGHVNFTALNNAGFANFSLSGFSLSTYDGTDLPATASGAKLCVGTALCDDNNVPEPASALLVAAALGGLALTRRKPALA
jgi:hypothetical protein